MAQHLASVAILLLLSLAGATYCTDASQSGCSAGWAQTEADDALELLQLQASKSQKSQKSQTLWPEIGICAISGSPSITSFDKKVRNKYLTSAHTYSGGDTWIVKNSQIHIQGRYIMIKNATESYLKMIAVGGPFLNFNGTNKLLIEGNGKKVYWNDKKILNHVGSKFQNAIVSVQSDGESRDVDHPERRVQMEGIHVTLPKGVRLLVNRAENGLEMRLTLPRSKDLDGECGNFNGNKTDDTVAEIKNRTNINIELEEMLLPAFSLDKKIEKKSHKAEKQ